MSTVLVTGNHHLSKANLPRYPQHKLVYSKKFPSGRLPLEKIWYPFENYATWQPIWQSYQLIHAFNAIPYTHRPFVVTFELFLPYVSIRNSKNHFERLLYEAIRSRLALDNCKRIIAISNYAKNRLLKQLKDCQFLDQFAQKVEVIHPNFPIRATAPKRFTGDRVELIFIGSHFARKGGIVALRLAEKAHQLGLPIQIHIVSLLKYGAGVPTDFPDPARYAHDLKRLDLPNVTFHQKLPNSEVLHLLSQCHFQLLATLEDTYGFSIVEGFSVATPAIGSSICALPELIQPGVNGYLLNLEQSDSGTWAGYQHWRKLRDDPTVDREFYWERLNQTYDDLAEQALQTIFHFLDQPDRAKQYEQLSAGALHRAKQSHDANQTNERFHTLYTELSR